MSDILSQLRQLGVSIGMPENLKKKPSDSDGFTALEKAFPNGQIFSNDFGNVFRNRIVYPLSESHGKICLNRELMNNPLFDMMVGWEGITRAQTLAMDTETSGLSTAAAAFVFMIGFGYFEKNQYVVDQLILPDLNHEPAFLREIEQTFARFDYLLTYNGKSFDVPMIQNRGNFHAFPPFCKKIRHIDLLTIVRRYWREDLENCRLATVERDILNVQRGTEEVPGHLAPELYREFLGSGNAECLRGIAYHNQIDVLSLSALLMLLNELDLDKRGHDRMERFPSLNNKIAAHWRRHRADPSDAAAFCSDQVYTISQRKSAAARFGRQGMTSEMTRILESLASEGDLQSMLKLSAHFALQPETCCRGIDYLDQALALLESDDSLGVWSRKSKVAIILRKRERLIKKAGKSDHGSEN